MRAYRRLSWGLSRAALDLQHEALGHELGLDAVRAFGSLSKQQGRGALVAGRVYVRKGRSGPVGEVWSRPQSRVYNKKPRAGQMAFISIVEFELLKEFCRRGFRNCMFPGPSDLNY